jgi:hypothetical protein
VTDFPESTVRADIMAGFEVVYERATHVQIDGEFWINGSFTTKKIDPDDIDFILVTDPRFSDEGSPEQRDFIEWLISNERDPQKAFSCDTDVVFRFPKESPWYEHFTGSILRHWEYDVYGKSVSSGEPKGIVVVSINNPVLSEAGEAKDTSNRKEEAEP